MHCYVYLRNSFYSLMGYPLFLYDSQIVVVINKFLKSNDRSIWDMLFHKHINSNSTYKIRAPHYFCQSELILLQLSHQLDRFLAQASQICGWWSVFPLNCVWLGPRNAHACHRARTTYLNEPHGWSAPRKSTGTYVHQINVVHVRPESECTHCRHQKPLRPASCPTRQIAIERGWATQRDIGWYEAVPVVVGGDGMAGMSPCKTRSSVRRAVRRRGAVRVAWGGGRMEGGRVHTTRHTSARLSGRVSWRGMIGRGTGHRPVKTSICHHLAVVCVACSSPVLYCCLYVLWTTLHAWAPLLVRWIRGNKHK